MSERVAPVSTGTAFSSLISCSANMPVGAVAAKIGATSIPARMPNRVRQMAIFGDTGCRLKGSTIQECNSTTGWPLAQMAQSIASDKPDLMVFTGDFLYRETACPDELADRCAGSPAPVSGMPFKDSAESWKVDVFGPMKPLLSAAPLLITRGNHEACSRGGNGYFIYMDPRAGTENTCAPFTDSEGALQVPENELMASFAVDVNIASAQKLRFVVVDAAYGEDCEVSDFLDKQRRAFTDAQKLAAGHTSWLVVHKPIVAWQPADDCAPTGGWIAADQTVASFGLLNDYNLMLSSHIHVVESVNIPGLPAQLVIGNGGSLLEQSSSPIPDFGPSFPGVTYAAPTSSWMAVRFGYVLARPTSGHDWSMQMRNPDGTSFATCELRAKRLDCADN